MARVVLFDVDSRIPNLALMKLSAYHKARGWEVVLSRKPVHIGADRYLAGTVFYCASSRKKLDMLRVLYGDGIQIGGSGIDLARRLPSDVDVCFPDYSLYDHSLYALGFLTRGCHRRCSFCVVPYKEGTVKQASASFDDFVPSGQRNVMLLDDNLLSFEGVETLLKEMEERRLAVNFSQTLDISYLTERVYERLLKVNYQNARFTRKRIYFSCNYPGTISHFTARRTMLKGFGPDAVCVVCIYGFDTRLSQDYARWLMLRHFLLVPFFQEYWPIPNVPSRLPAGFFDMDLNEVIRLTFRSNGLNWEKYLRWLNRLYFRTFGRYYRPLVEIIYRYNNKYRIERYLRNPRCLTRELYRTYEPFKDRLANLREVSRKCAGA
jgi:hypothetical protein